MRRGCFGTGNNHGRGYGIQPSCDNDPHCTDPTCTKMHGWACREQKCHHVFMTCPGYDPQTKKKVPA